MRLRQLCVLPACVAVVLSGCTVGPNYHKPVTGAPGGFRGAAPALTQQAAQGGPSLGALAWQQVFTDPTLQGLLRTALARNQDLAVAAARIEQSRAALRLAQLQDFPLIEGQANYIDQRLSQEGLPAEKVTGNPEGSAGIGSLSLSWEIDFWGRYRRAREAARARLLATRAAQDAVRMSLIASVADTYYRMREYDAELIAARQSLALRTESLRLTQAREQGGVASLLDVRQAQTLVTEARKTILTLQELIPQTENQIQLLLGGYPGDVSRGLPLAQDHIPDLPPGLPSTVMERRPDIRQSEDQLRAANADIGVVRAEYFPNIGLTSSVGTESAAFTDLFTGNATNWLVQPALNVPVFTAGRIHAREQRARAQEQAALHRYQATVRRAFEEVSDALIAREETLRLRLAQDKQVGIAQNAAVLSRARYKGGVANYLEVLETERSSLSAQLSLAQDEFNELDAGVQLYEALGGGWQH
jgi:multidrug efflux system outer membrane protein